MKILITDDDEVICDILGDLLIEMGHDVNTVGSAAATKTELANDVYDLLLLDLRLPDSKDLALLAEVRKSHPRTNVIIVTAEVDNLGLVAEATRLGAFDYIPKPIREEDIRIRVTRVMELRGLQTKIHYAFTSLAKGSHVDDIVGESQEIQSVRKLTQEYAKYDMPALILGETGCGKELIAKALHYESPRREKPFYVLNCASLSPSLIESELFGHEKGSFTGATSRHKGAFEEAKDGTLFLDEIGDMSLPAQASLLRVLESGKYRSIGGSEKSSNARIVLATNQALEQLIKDGRFRQDLYHRINRLFISLPPLRNRPTDIPLLVEHFLTNLNHQIGKKVSGVSESTMKVLMSYQWPGNVRELKNEIERSYIHADTDTIEQLDLSMYVILANQEQFSTSQEVNPLDEAMELINALKKTNGNVSAAAKLLGVHRNTLHRWMTKYGINLNDKNN